MALSTYTELKAAVIDQSHRDDLDLKIDDFIQLAETEARANPDEPLNLRASEVEVELSTVVDSSTVALPSGFSHARGLRITVGGEKVRLTYREPSSMLYRSGSGEPFAYTVIANNIQFDIATDAIYTVTLQYLGDFPALTSAAPTNIVLTKYPNIYLFGCLKQANIYADDDEKALKYNLLFADAIKSANIAEARGRYSDSPTIAVGWAP